MLNLPKLATIISMLQIAGDCFRKVDKLPREREGVAFPYGWLLRQVQLYTYFAKTKMTSVYWKLRICEIIK